MCVSFSTHCESVPSIIYYSRGFPTLFWPDTPPSTQVGGWHPHRSWSKFKTTTTAAGHHISIFVLLPGNESGTPWICVRHPQGVPTPQVGNPCATVLNSLKRVHYTVIKKEKKKIILSIVIVPYPIVLLRGPAKGAKQSRNVVLYGRPRNTKTAHRASFRRPAQPLITSAHRCAPLRSCASLRVGGAPSFCPERSNFGLGFIGLTLHVRGGSRIRPFQRRRILKRTLPAGVYNTIQ